MKITVITSTYNYLDNISFISKWIYNEFKKLGIEYTFILYNDNENNKDAKEFNLLEKHKDVIIIHTNKNSADLRIPYKRAALNAINKNHDAILIIESDALPNDTTFENMLEVFKNPFRTPLASVSPMYAWNNKYCYPTHEHWKTDGLNVKNGRLIYKNIGIVTDVGAPGVPFVFTLWTPESLIQIDYNMSVPIKMYQLDGTFGKYMHDKGYHHLRLIDNSVEHINGGQKSWRNKETTNMKKIPNSSPPIIQISVNTTLTIKPVPTPRKIIHFNENGTKIFKPDVNQNLLAIEKNQSQELGKNKYTDINENIDICVALHLYYTDLWPEFSAYLDNIKTDFDLYVTMCEGSIDYKNLIKQKELILKKYPRAKIFIIDNRGLDIGGFLYVLKYLIDKGSKYDYFLKIHSKKSLHTSTEIVGNKWRKELLVSLLGSVNIIENNLKLLKFNDDIGMIGSNTWLIDTENKRQAFMNNYEKIKELAKLFKIKTDINKFNFIGGTMFWVDYNVLVDRFKTININFLRNMLEYGAITDHQKSTYTHSMERILGILMKDSNKIIKGI